MGWIKIDSTLFALTLNLFSNDGSVCDVIETPHVRLEWATQIRRNLNHSCIVLLYSWMEIPTKNKILHRRRATNISKPSTRHSINKIIRWRCLRWPVRARGKHIEWISNCDSLLFVFVNDSYCKIFNKMIYFFINFPTHIGRCVLFDSLHWLFAISSRDNAKHAFDFDSALTQPTVSLRTNVDSIAKNTQLKSLLVVLINANPTIARGL